MLHRHRWFVCMATLSIQMNVAAASRTHAKGSVRQVLGQDFVAVQKIACMDDGARLHAACLHLVPK